MLVTLLLLRLLLLLELPLPSPFPGRGSKNKPLVDTAASADIAAAAAANTTTSLAKQETKKTPCYWHTYTTACSCAVAASTAHLWRAALACHPGSLRTAHRTSTARLAPLLASHISHVSQASRAVGGCVGGSAPRSPSPLSFPTAPESKTQERPVCPPTKILGQHSRNLSWKLSNDDHNLK